MTPQDLAVKLRTMVESHVDELDGVPEEAAEETPEPAGAWTKKQELGHLIDSAANNHHRFVLAGIGSGEYRGMTYAQDAWVDLHGYSELPWDDLVTFWCSYNLLLEHLVSRLPEDRMGTLCYVGANEPVTLEWLIDDYMLHMQHHLDHILEREEITKYPAA